MKEDRKREEGKPKTTQDPEERKERMIQIHNQNDTDIIKKIRRHKTQMKKRFEKDENRGRED